MTDLANLQTASLYINNQLLSRGLLRDGRSIDFANPTGGAKEDVSKKDSEDGSDYCKCNGKGVDHTADTMARIINVVNDLILRRDRDAEHRESLSTALRTLRADSLRQARDLQRATERHAEAQRRADLGDAAETSLRAQLAAADAAKRKLREEAARIRQQAAQTRASCANEVRKRDRQIDSLKKAVSDAGRARGERRNPAITTITITGASTTHQQPQQYQHKHRQIPSPSIGSSSQSTPPVSSGTIKSNTTSIDGSTAALDWGLRGETNAFLTELARGLSEDKELLVDLVRHTNQRLKIMSGYVGKNEEQTEDDSILLSGAVNCGAMVVQMEAVLEHLQTILTNPSFVPIEEVVERESEIGRLRDGWEKMEDRWKEAVHLLDGWRRRMAISGRPVNLEELKIGLSLSPVRVRNVTETTMGLNLQLQSVQNDSLSEVADYGECSDDDGDEDENDSQKWSSLGHTLSPVETMHTAPAAGTHNFESGHELLSDSESGFDSDSDEDTDNDDLYDKDEPRTNNDKHFLVKPSLEAPVVTLASTRLNPSPPPPEKQVMPQITATANQDKVAEKQKEAILGKPLAARAKPSQNTLQPSRTAGNRGGLDDIAHATKLAAIPSVKRVAANLGEKTVATGNTTTVTRGRRRPEEVEDAPKERKQVRIVATATTFDKPSARLHASRIGASTATTTESTTTTGLRRVNSAKPAAVRPVPTSKPAKPASNQTVSLAQGKQRPASAASQALDTSSAPSPVKAECGAVSVPVTSITTTSSRPEPFTLHRSTAIKSSSAIVPAANHPQPGRVNRSASDKKSPASTSSSSEQIPQPSAPRSLASIAQRARSRSPVKEPAAPATATASDATSTATATAGGVTSRLPLPTSSNLPPPPSPALNMATIAAKLAASEREADAARVRAKLKAARNGMPGVTKAKVTPDETSAHADTVNGIKVEAEANPDLVKEALSDNHGVDAFARTVTSASGEPQEQQPLRKKRDTKDQRRVSKAASRRRSTLNPWELKSLMSGNVEGAASAEEPVVAAL
ncbi:hypothetical protein SEPCBS57363_004813 [Sporothrix epigloea]|uniref:NIMA interactive protein n=1 Tax=Sporothrix epigloea TaxID=1892477 RepID=A0ABP0DXZ8_9PEZI